MWLELVLLGLLIFGLVRLVSWALPYETTGIQRPAPVRAVGSALAVVLAVPGLLYFAAFVVGMLAVAVWLVVSLL